MHWTRGTVFTNKQLTMMIHCIVFLTCWVEEALEKYTRPDIRARYYDVMMM